MEALEGQARLPALVARLCDKRSASLDSSTLGQIKALCKQDDVNVLAAFDSLWDQLRERHAQTRLLALLACEQLFQRSRVFREALVARLPQFLEAVLGLRAEQPLPPPPHVAESLREKALELLERWQEQYGAKYKQLLLAARYLQTRHLSLPGGAGGSEAAAAEAAAAAEREDAQRRELQGRLAALLGGGGAGAAFNGSNEWDEGLSASRELLVEMQECFSILDEHRRQQQQQQQQAARQAAAAERAAAADGLQWEDVAVGGDDAAVPAAGAADAVSTAVEQQEGLAAYGAASSSAAGPGGEPANGGGEPEADLEAVQETLTGLYRQLTNRALPQVQDWLSLLSRAETETAGQELLRQRRLREATQLRGQLAAAKQRCDASALDLEALLQQRRRREAAATQAGQHASRQPEGQEASGQQQRVQPPPAAAAEALVQQLFGGSGSDSEGHAEADNEAQEESASRRSGGRFRQQGGAASSAAAAAATAAAAAARRRPRPRVSEAAEADFESPYLRIVDPAAPRAQPPLAPGQQQQQQQQQQVLAKERRQRAAQEGGSLPEALRQKLVAQAPVLPSGTHTLYWDSKSAPSYVSGHGLEVGNHWGPVDVHRELPQERVDEMFMIAMPSRPTQQQQQATQQKQQIQQQQGSQQQQKQRHESGNKRPSSAAAAAARGLPAASPAGILQALSGAAGSSQPRSQAQPQPLASSEAATAEQPGESDQRAAKRARRAQERAYNESVIAGAANPNEQLARQLQEAEQQAAAAAADGGGRGRGRGQGRQGRGKKMGVKDRLAQKLLRGAVVAAAGAESARAEGEARRDKFGVHQW
ncbi:hypothetical protein D9Q98_003743 [Chlorella vulgaris]|uniref:Uncharacterized protein n=1 Tax=Chlorella vulgaris TaxID=3077 RepID=A0A9D4TTA5_CHLVU|nr:hypothetical protein D9Q98_003743 [Chlorella vulgaris]